MSHFIIHFTPSPSTYGHRQQKTGHPVRSAIHKLLIGRLVVGSVTTSESLLLYVFEFLILRLNLLYEDFNLDGLKGLKGKEEVGKVESVWRCESKEDGRSFRGSLGN
jgi:hypothetical protein